MTSRQLTEAERSKLRDLVRRLRMVALRPEICAGVWQAIFDIEAKLASGDPHFREGPEQTIDLAERALRNSRSSNRRRQSV